MPFLRVVDLSKRYGGIEALQRVNLDIFSGEVIGVVGDTYSGKSTLLRLIAGAIRPDKGKFYVQGRAVRLAPPHRAGRYGIRVVHQDINDAQLMTGIGYIFAGRPPRSPLPLRWLGWWDQRNMEAIASAEFERLGFEPPSLTCRLNDLTSAQRKMVAFVHATIRTPHLLVLDEPMNALEQYQAEIFRLIEETRARGGAVLLVTQNIDDIFRLSDRIIVLNAGQKIAERRAAETTQEEIVRLILELSEDKRSPAVWALSTYFEVRQQAEKLNQLNQKLEKRAVQLNAHADVARSVTSILDLDELLRRIVKIIGERFSYYHVAIFLADEGGEFVLLRNSAGPEPPPAEQVRLRVGEGSMIGWCAATGQAQLANDVSDVRNFRHDAGLPNTRSELALPLRIGTRVLGVLDLQAERQNSFDEEDVFVLQGLADQLAIAIRNAELFEAAQVARQQADRASRFKSIFLSNMSHELRTPLSAIIGHTKAMMSTDAQFYDSPIPDEYLHDLRTICRSGEHLLALINDILDLSQIETGEFKLNFAAIDLKSILDHAIQASYGLLHSRPVDLKAHYPDDLPPVWGDHLRTQQIVLNLLSNAVKYTEEGAVTVSAETAGSSVVVSVLDTGIGIPEHILPYLFDRLNQPDLARSKKYGGTGLGLNISKQLVELQGGKIHVESQVGVGSLFRFSIPIATTEQLALTGGQVIQSPPIKTGKSIIFETPVPSTTRLILLLQDECTEALRLQQDLETAGYVVEQANVDQSALDLADVIAPDGIIFHAGNAGAYALLEALLVSPYTASTPILVIVSNSGTPRSELPAIETRIVPVQIMEKTAPGDIIRALKTVWKD